MSHSITRLARGALISVAVTAVAALLSITATTAAQAATDPAPLSLTAVGQAGSYFDVTMNPGDTRTLQVSRTNPGMTAATALTYAASVFTIVNGGFGAQGSDDPATGATTWVRYANEVFPLAAGETNSADFTVTVPAGTAPGQYISSIVLQNNVAIPGQGQVALDRVVRQAVAISITVPGALEPTFSLGAASSATVGGRSVVSVALKNTGNQNLKPAGTMAIKDASRKVVSEAPVTMGSVYAGMPTTVAVTLDGLLLPGKYTVTLELADVATGASASITDVPFTVLPPNGPTVSALTELPAIVQDAIERPGWVTVLLVLLVASLLALVTAAVVLIRRSRKGVFAPASAAAATVSVEPPTPTPSP